MENKTKYAGSFIKVPIAATAQQIEAWLRELILGNPADVKLLKQEYYEATGKRFRRRKGE